MALPVGYLPREGDVLVLYAEVKYDVARGDPYVHVKMAHNSFGLDLESDLIGGIKHRVWKEGEKVKHRNIENVAGSVVAASGDFVWIKLDHGTKHTKHTHNGHLTAHCNEIETRDHGAVTLAKPDEAAAIPEEPPAASPASVSGAEVPR
jgi:hypothetical protein